MKEEVIIVGGGAAGMMAAIFAARNNANVTIFEQNEKLGKKLFITGKGRCNYTNACDLNTLINSVLTNQKFMYGSFKGFDSEATISFFEELGLKGKVERGNRVFPISDKSSDVIKALEKELNRLKVQVFLNTRVESLIVKEKEENKKECLGIKISKNKEVYASKVIVATGGLSYQSTGARGDGHRMAKENGHKIEKLYPGLAPINIKEDIAKKMQGVSLKNVQVRIASLYDKNGASNLEKKEEISKKDIYYSDFGEMIFTHFGVSGPLILTAQSIVSNKLEKEKMILEIDLKPALDNNKLENRIKREIDLSKSMTYKNLLRKLLPEKCVEVFLELTKVDKNKKSCDLSKIEIKNLIYNLKHLKMTIAGNRNINEGIITKGGVSTKEINPKTMESKLIKNLHFAGEIIDVDAITGGFNLQIAWSTAVASANN